MPFWSDDTWVRLAAEGNVPVDPFDEKRLEEAKYIMSVGEEVYISSSKAGNTIVPLKENEAFQLGPGQFAHILTHETVRIPLDAVGFISINARVKLEGLVNISGFHVDPGWRGKLTFSVFNAAPKSIHLRRGQAIFPLWVASLDSPTKKAKSRSGNDKLDPNLITAISGSGNYTTAFELDQVIRTLRNEFDKARIDISALQASRSHVTILIAILALIFGGVATALVKTTFDWIVYGPPLFATAPALVLPPVVPLPARTSPQSPASQPIPALTPKSEPPHG